MFGGRRLSIYARFDSLSFLGERGLKTQVIIDQIKWRQGYLGSLDEGCELQANQP
jgi:hypothetical protein